MPSSNPRYTIHPPSIQQAPPSYELPKKKLSHTSKAVPSDLSRGGAVHPIPKRKITLGGFIGAKLKIGGGSPRRR